MTHLNEPLATAEHNKSGWTIRFERHYAHPPEKVWRAITESEHLEHWLPCDIVGERRPGAEIELPFWPAHVEKYAEITPTLAGEIRAWEPPKVFEWTWDTDVLRFELEPTGQGTRLVFTTQLDDDPAGAAGAAGAAAGYHACFDNLLALLDHGTAPPLIDAEVGPNEGRYRALISATQQSD